MLARRAIKAKANAWPTARRRCFNGSIDRSDPRLYTPKNASVPPAKARQAYIVKPRRLRVYISGDTEATADMWRSGKYRSGVCLYELPFNHGSDLGCRSGVTFKPAFGSTLSLPRCADDGTKTPRLFARTMVGEGIEVRMGEWY